ncbi:hypothetical protein CRUP_004928, partial [Coryphaenoides rupestris]
QESLAPADGRRPRAKELEELRLREQYLLHEDGAAAGDTELRHLDKAMFRNFLEVIDEEDDDPEGGAGVLGGAGAVGLKKSVSSPSLELEMVPPVAKVRRNVSERRTYRRNVIAR